MRALLLDWLGQAHQRVALVGGERREMIEDQARLRSVVFLDLVPVHIRLHAEQITLLYLLLERHLRPPEPGRGRRDRRASFNAGGRCLRLRIAGEDLSGTQRALQAAVHGRDVLGEEQAVAANLDEHRRLAGQRRNGREHAAGWRRRR
jgi:hypothetical protein